MSAVSGFANDPIAIRTEWLKLVEAKRKLPPVPLMLCNEDGTHHFSEIKKLALSAQEYIHNVNHPTEPTSNMLVGTAVHFLVLGPRTGAKPLKLFTGSVRRGKEWDRFVESNPSAEILTISEWQKAEDIAEAVLNHPVARARLEGARFEVPVAWEEPGGIKCSTSGIDIVCSEPCIADLKMTFTVHPDSWMRHAFKMLYPMQMAWYRRGARANDIPTDKGLFILGVQSKAPHDVVELELTDDMIDFADRTIELWLGKLRVYRDSNQWPGYAQAPIPFDVPSWLRDEDEDEEEGRIRA